MLLQYKHLGTTLDEAFVESIRTDLNSRLLISSKATTAEAQAGTNTTKYMTPATTKEAIKYQTKTISISSLASSAEAFTLLDVANLPSDVKRVTIIGSASGSPTTFSFTGTGWHKTEKSVASGTASLDIAMDTTAPTAFSTNENWATPFKVEVDLVAKTIAYAFYIRGSSDLYIDGLATYSTLTTIAGSCKRTSSTQAGTVNATVINNVG